MSNILFKTCYKYLTPTISKYFAFYFRFVEERALKVHKCIHWQIFWINVANLVISYLVENPSELLEVQSVGEI